MRFALIVPFLVFVGCSAKQESKVVDEDYVTQMKFCKRECIQDQFTVFHNNGKSWGTGSSSMNGIQETEIMKKVEDQCKEFLEGEKCCHDGGHASILPYRPEVLSYRFRNSDFGVCK